MRNVSRIPECKSYSFDGMLSWFAEMSVSDLLFHPDDDPADIVRIVDNAPLFDKSEALQVRTILGRMFFENGDDVYDAAYPIFMKRMGIQLDA